MARKLIWRDAAGRYRDASGHFAKRPKGPALRKRVRAPKRPPVGRQPPPKRRPKEAPAPGSAPRKRSKKRRPAPPPPKRRPKRAAAQKLPPKKARPRVRKPAVVPSVEGLRAEPRPAPRSKSIHRTTRRRLPRRQVTDLPVSRSELQDARAFMKQVAVAFKPYFVIQVYLQPLSDHTVDAEVRFRGPKYLESGEGASYAFLLLLEEQVGLALLSYPGMAEWWLRLRFDWEGDEDEDDEYRMGRHRGKMSNATNVVRRLSENAVVFEAGRAVIDNTREQSAAYRLTRVSMWLYKSAQKPRY